ncbi:MAG: hypothetical protein IIU58_03885, partial [Clostridia bacterium]|nr:hypothetical protein [Clostridia bacterium]
MEFRIEHDSMGEVKVPADRLWAAQTQRSHENFEIGVGIETMPAEIVHAFGVLKKAAAIANNALRPEKMTEEKLGAIKLACDEVMAGTLRRYISNRQETYFENDDKNATDWHWFDIDMQMTMSVDQRVNQRANVKTWVEYELDG